VKHLPGTAGSSEHDKEAFAMQQMQPPQQSQPCPYTGCGADNWFVCHPDAPVSARLFYNCWRCGKSFCHNVGSDRPITLFAVRCEAAMNALGPFLTLAWVAGAAYVCWLIVHRFGILVLVGTVLLPYSVLASLRHEGLKAIPSAALLFTGAVVLTRFTLLEVLPRVPTVQRLGLAPVTVNPLDVTPIAALMVLVVALAAWFGAAPAPYTPEDVPIDPRTGILIDDANGLEGSGL
jgi:hypothetical protein